MVSNFVRDCPHCSRWLQLLSPEQSNPKNCGMLTTLGQGSRGHAKNPPGRIIRAQCGKPGLLFRGLLVRGASQDSSACYPGQGAGQDVCRARPWLGSKPGFFPRRAKGIAYGILAVWPKSDKPGSFSALLADADEPGFYFRGAVRILQARILFPRHWLGFDKPGFFSRRWLKSDKTGFSGFGEILPVRKISSARPGALLSSHPPSRHNRGQV